MTARGSDEYPDDAAAAQFDAAGRCRRGFCDGNAVADRQEDLVVGNQRGKQAPAGRLVQAGEGTLGLAAAGIADEQQAGGRRRRRPSRGRSVEACGSHRGRLPAATG